MFCTAKINQMEWPINSGVVIVVADENDSDLINQSHRWSNKDILYADYKYISRLIDSVVSEVALLLNKTLGTNNSNQYWENVLTPWVSRYLSVFFDRFINIKHVVDNYKILQVGVLKSDEDYITPSTYVDFIRLIGTHDYNLILESIILRKLISDDVPVKDICLQNSNSRNKKNKGNKKHLKFILYECLYLLNKISIRRKVAILSYNFSLLTYLTLSFKLRSFPTIPLFNFDPNKEVFVRKKSNANKISCGDDTFKKIINETIVQQIPKSYMEGHEAFIDKISSSMPKRVDIVLSETLFWTDDLIRIWVAKLKEVNTKNYIIQHGGGYGAAYFLLQEDLEIKLSDKFICWGKWGRYLNNPDKIVSKPSIKLARIPQDISKENTKIMLPLAGPLITYVKNIGIGPNGRQWSDLHNSVERFILNLDDEIKKEIIVRLPATGNSDPWKLQNKFSNIVGETQIQQSNIPFHKAINEAGFFVGVYDSTTILEALSSGMPCIFFWDSQEWVLRESAKKLYESLVDVGVLHNSYKSASVMLNKVYYTRNDWWCDYDRKNAVEEFKNNFAYTNDKYYEIWVNLLSNT